MSNSYSRLMKRALSSSGISLVAAQTFRLRESEPSGSQPVSQVTQRVV